MCHDVTNTMRRDWIRISWRYQEYYKKHFISHCVVFVQYQFLKTFFEQIMYGFITFFSKFHNAWLWYLCRDPWSTRSLCYFNCFYYYSKGKRWSLNFEEFLEVFNSCMYKSLGVQSKDKCYQFCLLRFCSWENLIMYFLLFSS